MATCGIPRWRYAGLAFLASSKSRRNHLVRCARCLRAVTVRFLSSFGEGAGMSGISGRGEFADYRAIGKGVAIMPSVSVVIPAKNEARNLEHVFGTIPEWVSEIVLVDGHS